VTADNDNPQPTATTGRCPTCSKPTVRAYRPFCSERCKDVDLHRWLRGSYAIPGGNTDADEDGDDAAAELDMLQRNGPGGDVPDRDT
jgi:endogenous inhibitor of DNA gyrase (YacG/DUF329 family)